MSFDFDPNVNIDRAEDDNNPEDVASYLGGEGLYGRVPGGPQVGAANRSQGQSLGDQGLPIGRQVQAQARGGVGQARGASQDAKVDLKPLIVAVIPIYCLSETINLFFFLFFNVFHKLIIFNANKIF